MKIGADKVIARSWFDKTVQCHGEGTTGAYRCYFQLVAWLGGTHTNFHAGRLKNIMVNLFFR